MKMTSIGRIKTKQSSELFTELSTCKSWEISQKQVLNAYQSVKSNKGTGGVDGVNFEEFDEFRLDNLYVLWNRMSSGSYYPKAVREKRIPKYDGTKRSLGIPTITDRVGQQVVKDVLEERLEAIFHPDSYGYRSGKNAHEAVKLAEQRCWASNWVIDMDIQGFFDNINHELLLEAVSFHINPLTENWIYLYIERWLKAPILTEEGELIYREKGTPQGGVISPLLANLFLHYSFDKWMEVHHEGIKFERYADDIIVHCKSKSESKSLLKEIGSRLELCGLRLHPKKTNLVYCKQASNQNKKVKYGKRTFDFLGFEFKPRSNRLQDGNLCLGFRVGISKGSQKRITEVIKKLKIHRATGFELQEIANFIAPKLRGWINYFGKFNMSSLSQVMQRLNERLVRWAMGKYKRFRRNKEKARAYIIQIAEQFPNLFIHWQYGFTPR